MSIWPNGAARFSKICIRSSIFIILLIVIGATGAGRVDINKFAGSEIATLMAFIAGLATVSWIVPRLLRLNGPDTAAINIEGTFRNINLALLIKASLFPAVVGVADPVGDMVLFTLLLFGGLVFPVAALQVYLQVRIALRYVNGRGEEP